MITFLVESVAEAYILSSNRGASYHSGMIGFKIRSAEFRKYNVRNSPLGW